MLLVVWSSRASVSAVAAGEDGKSSSVSGVMYRDWMLSLRRPGCSRRQTRVREWALRGGKDCTAGWHWSPVGSLTVPGMMGWRRSSWSLGKDSEGREGPSALVSSVWTVMGDVGGQAGLDNLGTTIACPGIGERSKSTSKQEKDQRSKKTQCRSQHMLQTPANLRLSSHKMKTTCSTSPSVTSTMQTQQNAHAFGSTCTGGG